MTQPISKGALKLAQHLVVVIPDPDDDGQYAVHVGADKIRNGGVMQFFKDEHTANVTALQMIRILALAMDEHARRVLDIEHHREEA